MEEMGTKSVWRLEMNDEIVGVNVRNCVKNVLGVGVEIGGGVRVWGGREEGGEDGKLRGW